MNGALLGPGFSDAEIKRTLDDHHAVYEALGDDAVIARTAELLQQGKVVGWVQGRMEFGPRALGSRSILGDARSPAMQTVMNLKVKFRESFRPFAPIVRRERVKDYFELDTDSPYMLLVAPVQKKLRLKVPTDAQGFDRLQQVRSSIPAVTHVDYSARVQTVTPEHNARLYALLQRFEQATGCGVLVNTSFNVRGEPIVCTPDDAYRCFINTEMDYLVVGNYLLERTAQPHKRQARTFEPQPD
jgi:carbamoyltransferase